jgi:hypothetical protein
MSLCERLGRGPRGAQELLLCVAASPNMVDSVKTLDHLLTVMETDESVFARVKAELELNQGWGLNRLLQYPSMWHTDHQRALLAQKTYPILTPIIMTTSCPGCGKASPIRVVPEPTMGSKPKEIYIVMCSTCGPIPQ